MIAHSSFRYDYLATGLLSHVAMPQPLKTAEAVQLRTMHSEIERFRTHCLFAAVAPEILAQFPHDKHPPRIVVEVRIEEAYLHCAKALMRSHLWDSTRHIDRSQFPSMGQMIQQQSGSDEPAESQAQMLARYASEI